MNPDDLMQIQQLQKNQRLAQMLGAEGAAPIEAGRGFISPYQGLAKLAASLAGENYADRADKGQQALAKAQQERDKQAFGVNGVPGSLSISGNPESDYELYKRNPDAYLKALTEAKTPTSDMRNYTQSGAGSDAYKAKLLAEALKSKNEAASSGLMNVSAGNTLRDVATGGTWTAPKIDNVDTGGQVQTQIIDPNTGQVKVIGSTNKTASPAEREASSGVTYMTTADGSIVAVPKKPNGAPVGQVVTDQSGKPLAGKQVALTESQGNAALFGARAMEAEKVINDIGSDYNVSGLGAKKSAENIPLIGGIAGAAGNLLLSDNQQKVDQAQRDFINAVLRKESGASIGKDEFTNAQRQYFPQTGDSQAVLEQKAANRKTAIQGLNVMAGPGAAQMQNAASKKEGGVLKVDANGNKAIVYPDGTFEEQP